MNMTITESDKKLLSFLAAFLLAVVFLFLVFRPISEKNSELKKEITITKDQEIAMDMSASLAEDMATKEKNTQEKASQVVQRFYPMLQSQQAENMVTVLMLNHGLKVQSLSVPMPETPVDLKWYQYSEYASAAVMTDTGNGLEDEVKEEETESFGIYTARITCTAEGNSEDLMALVDDISANYPAISILGTEWSVSEKQTVVEKTVTKEKTEKAETEDSDDEKSDDEETETEQEEKAAEETVTTLKTEQAGSLTISLEIYMCER